jgi:ribonuclease PH
MPTAKNRTVSRRARAARADGRAPLDIRPMQIVPGFLDHAEGSALITAGQTRVLCAVSLEDRVPDFLVGKGRGWLTAEYAMLPRATHTRSQRESTRGKIGGRTHEIQRLIGRSLRAVVDLEKLGERTLTVDCDVLQADGGTRTTAINGAYVAVAQAVAKLVQAGVLQEMPLREPVAAISVGIVGRELLVDLAYTEDSRAEVDANFVMTGSGGIVEVQGTAEGRTFARRDLNRMVDAAWSAIQEINRLQAKAIAGSSQRGGTRPLAPTGKAGRNVERQRGVKRSPANAGKPSRTPRAR